MGGLEIHSNLTAEAYSFQGEIPAIVNAKVKTLARVIDADNSLLVHLDGRFDGRFDVSIICSEPLVPTGQSLRTDASSRFPFAFQILK